MTRFVSNDQEVLYYDAVYAHVLGEDPNALSGKSAVSFLLRSGLPMETIKKVVLSYNFSRRFGSLRSLHVL